MASQTVKLHETDLLVTGIIRRTAIPFKHKTKRVTENLNPHIFYINANTEIVSHKTNVFLKLHSLQLARANRLFICDHSKWCSEGVTLKDITHVLVPYCEGVLPVNILTNSKEMASILNYAIKNSITESTFVNIPKEAVLNKKYKPKVKVWCLKKRYVPVVNMKDMVEYYKCYPNNSSSRISVTKQHPYLMSAEKNMKKKKTTKNKNKNKKDVKMEDSNGGTESCITTYSFIGDDVYNVYKDLELLPPNPLLENGATFLGPPIIHIDMSNIGENTLSSILTMAHEYLFCKKAKSKYF